MTIVSDIHESALRLSPTERERLALLVWESLTIDPPTGSENALDPEGIAIAAQRDAEIENGSVKAISHQEFIARTGGAPE